MATDSSRESHGQRSLGGYSSWGHKEPHITKQLTLLNMPCLLYLFIINIYICFIFLIDAIKVQWNALILRVYFDAFWQSTYRTFPSQQKVLLCPFAVNNPLKTATDLLCHNKLVLPILKSHTTYMKSYAIHGFFCSVNCIWDIFVLCVSIVDSF